MKSMHYIRTQDRLSTQGSFILCDMKTTGFPIRYASQGFVDLFEYSAAECAGAKCGALVGAPSILEDPTSLAQAAATADMSLGAVQEVLGQLTGYAAGECKSMVAAPETRRSFALLVNRKKSGKLFVCELTMLVQRHPALGWSYSVGLQSDITREVSVGQLLRAQASTGGYAKLIASREQAMQNQLEVLGMQQDDVIEYLNEKAGEMWHDLMVDMSSTLMSPTKGTQWLASGPTTAGSSTGPISSADSLWGIGSLDQGESDSEGTWESGSQCSESNFGAGSSPDGTLLIEGEVEAPHIATPARAPTHEELSGAA